MIDNDHDGKETFHYTTEDSEAMNRHAGALGLPDRRMREAMTSDLSVMAARPIEAQREYIAHAVALLHGKPSLELSVTRRLSNVCDAAADGCIDDGYDLLIKCLRTGTVHGLRMVFVDGAPQICPLLENLYRTRRNAGEPAPTHYHSLSRRQVRVLQMIAQGMSNKRIARSLGITPETVKTHAKCILSKLEARTRAQAVARAEAIGLLDEPYAAARVNP
jgi:DNA-binding NarL/FixJ family response regulator